MQLIRTLRSQRPEKFEFHFTFDELLHPIDETSDRLRVALFIDCEHSLFLVALQIGTNTIRMQASRAPQL
jgi:hypothetical protein